MQAPQCRECLQSYHKIEFHSLPARFKRITDGAEQILFANALVDNVAQSLCACFGRKRQAALADALHFFKIILKE